MDLNATRMFVWLARQMMGRGLTEKIIQVGLHYLSTASWNFGC